MLSLDRLIACHLRALLPLAFKSQLLATLHPKRKVCVIGVCGGFAYATSATFRPLAGGEIPCEAGRGNGVYVAQDPPAIRSLA